jgi:quercetin dioxygenase-like cupin family protein
MMYALKVTGLVSVALILPSLVLAQAAPRESRESALAISATDSSLKWGPCPEFMPSECRLAVLHGDPAKPNADVLLKVPAGQQLAHHWHSSAERMVLISGELEVAYDGQQPATLKVGMYAYGPAKAPHSATCRSADDCMLFIGFEGPIDAVPTAGAGKGE